MSPPTGWFCKCRAVNSLILIKTLHSIVVGQYLFLKMGSQMGSRGFKKSPQDLNIHILKIKRLIPIFWIICMAILGFKSQYLHLVYVYELTGTLPFRAGYGQTRRDALLLNEDQPAQRFQSIFICLSAYLPVYCTDQPMGS